MSEDETGNEGTWKYVIRAMDWRSEKLIPYLNIVDIGKRPKNVFGKMPSGNAPRTRIRRAGGKVWEGQAVPGMPQNFYDETWFAGLTEADRVALKAVNPVAFPSLESYYS